MRPKVICEITGEELKQTQISENDFSELIDDLIVTGRLLATIEKHFETSHSLSFIEYETIKRLAEKG